MNILTKFLHKTENLLARKHWAGERPSLAFSEGADD